MGNQLEINPSNSGMSSSAGSIILIEPAIRKSVSSAYAIFIVHPGKYNRFLFVFMNDQFRFYKAGREVV